MSEVSSTQAWIQAARLRTLPLASAGIIMGTALASFLVKLNWLVAALALLTAIALQVLSNFANDLGDFQKGTDNEDRVGPERALQSGAISEAAMKRAVIITAIISLGLGLSLLRQVFGAAFFKPLPLILLGWGLAGIMAAVKYTVGKSAFGYHGLGDLVVFLFFGLTGVCGAFVLQTGMLDPLILLPASGIGLFSAAVLNLNNMRDIENDKSQGKITLAVRLGFENAKTYHACLVLAGWLLITIFWILNLGEPLTLIIFIPGAIFAIHLKFAIGNDKPAAFDPELKKVALATLALAIAFAILAWLKVIYLS